ncbi:hypothetical protein [Dysgonomonas sp. BGC7]|uniref:terminase small subunit-like protein n=1 Tax=Dysgonomonas sp. BGC7 TaxID=1658008 RepID=UPI00067FC23E|nr:hypothetical protein [Dysgonomonas sp. BGC7]MBD8388727.1 hypothetical protein [Dysgonomonas sp. BGC7]
MAKYTERLANRIVSLIEADYYSITEICNSLKINTKTFYEWKKTKPEFREAVKDAEERRDDALAVLARRSLREELEGYVEVTEKYVYEDDGYGSEKIKSRIVTKKKRAPKAHVLKMVLERQEKRKNETNQEVVKHTDKPIVMKIPKDVNPVNAVKSIIDFKHKMRSIGLSEEQVKSVQEDENYMSVVV